ncbi:hypothetical protein GCM10010270_24310 [Streptomyces violaceus]|nr:hypothetical protein GCM10010270_24310 [Streptomyces janthinus]
MTTWVGVTARPLPAPRPPPWRRVRNAERLIADLHGRWVFGWERDEGDAPFGFRRTFGEFYDFSSPDVRLCDDFDPEQRVMRPGPCGGGMSLMIRCPFRK